MDKNKYNIKFSVDGTVTDVKQISSILRQISNDIDNNRLKLHSNTVKVERHAERKYCVDKECLCEVFYKAVENDPNVNYGE